MSIENVNVKLEVMARRFNAISHVNRLAIFELLVRSGIKGLCVGDILREQNLKAAGLTFHLKILSDAGLVSSRRQGRYTCYTASFKAMNEVISYLAINCMYSSA